MKVKEIMAHPVHTIERDRSARAAAQTMREARIGFLPVVDSDGHAVGAITDRDLAVRVVAEGRDSDVLVSEIMSTRLTTCLQSEDLTDVEEKLDAAQISRIIVLDETGKVTGIVSLTDISQVRVPSRAGRILHSVASRKAHHPKNDD